MKISVPETLSMITRCQLSVAGDCVDDYQLSVISCRRLCRLLPVVTYQLPETVAIVDNYVAKGYEDTNEDEDLFLNDGGDGAGELTKVGN